MIAHNSVDMSGLEFGRLKVLSRAGTNIRKLATWWCQCSCGTTKEISGADLRSGRTNSCGCMRKELLSKQVTSHGMSSTRFYKIWAGMVVRCEKPSHKQFYDYGGRGISVSERWRVFENFSEDMLTKYEEHKETHGESNTTLERLDTDGDYEKANCVWATRTIQSRNQRIRSNNTTGIKGVSRRKCGKYQATITVNGNRRYLGLFESIEDAAKSRRSAEEMYWTETKTAQAEIEGVTH